jgi:hypothetical protein
MEFVSMRDGMRNRRNAAIPFARQAMPNDLGLMRKVNPLVNPAGNYFGNSAC